MESVLVRGLSVETIKSLDEEAQRNQLSRNTLLQMLLSRFAKEVALYKATEILLEPIDDVKRQLQTLEMVQRESAKNISHDLLALNQSIRQLIKYMYDDTFGEE